MLGAGFLELIGVEFVASEDNAVIKTLTLDAGELTEASYVDWLSQNSRVRTTD